MERSLSERGTEIPERLVERLLSHLKRHVLWDSLLKFSPPLLVFSYLAIFFYDLVWVTLEIIILAGVAVLGVALMIEILRHRPKAPSARLAARLIDDKVEGEDRFVTLATLDPSLHPSLLVARLRHEAAGLLHRIELKRDFPYRVKRSFFASLISSLAVFLLFYLLLQIPSFFTPQATSVKELVKELSQVPRFSELARSLETTAARMQEEDLSREEKRSSIQSLLKQVEDQHTTEQQEGGAGSDLLSRTAETLRGMEQGLEKGQEQRGGGGMKTNLPEEGKGKGKRSSKGNSEKGRGELSTGGANDLKGGSSAEGKTPEGGKRKGERGQGKGGDEIKGKREKGGKVEGLAKGELEGKGARNKGEEIPRGVAPERFLRPGEQGEKGIKGARFVTVQLPEEEIEGSPGEGKRRGLRPKIPVSNVPLQRPDSPDLSPERQPLPLEYRGLIR